MAKIRHMRLVRDVCALVVLACVLGWAPGAFAQANIPLTVTGHEATGVIQLPGDVEAELSITFEEVVGLNPEALEVSASLVNPLDAGLLARLGGGGLITPPTAFPVVIRIEPSASSALSFSGTVALSLHTHNLNLVPNVPLATQLGQLGEYGRLRPSTIALDLPGSLVRRGVLGWHRTRLEMHDHRLRRSRHCLGRKQRGAGERRHEGPAHHAVRARRMPRRARLRQRTAATTSAASTSARADMTGLSGRCE